MNHKNVVCVIGTRPEAIKMVPVIRALQRADWARCVVVATAQHRDLLDQVLGRFQIDINHDLNLMLPDQSLSELVGRMCPKLDWVLRTERAHAVLAQGDTTTVLVAAIAAFHRQLAFGHVEAGLRTNDLDHPFPEEGYRQMVSRIARWNFAPTQRAAAALRAEGIDPARVHLTGNTCIDTLLHVVDSLPPADAGGREERIVLLTAHRRESFGEPLRNIFKAVRSSADKMGDVRFVYPMHPNPNVRELAKDILAGHPKVDLIEPLDYFEFVGLMQQATVILTDSGGIQEEAPSLGKPVLVLRDTTERPEAVEAGVAMLVGTRQEAVEDALERILADRALYRRMSRASSPFGDGHAATRIVEALRGDLTESGENYG